MARIVFATLGSLGDVHPVLALALEMKARGHWPIVATSEYYRPKVTKLGLEFAALRPEMSFVDEAFVRDVMDGVQGGVRLLRDFIFPAVSEMYEDLRAACLGADLLVSSELIYAAPILAEKTGLPWISFSLAPISLFSSHDVRVPPVRFGGTWLRALPPFVFRALTVFPRLGTWNWWRPVRKLRQELGLGAGRHPLFEGKFSSRRDLALFSPVVGGPQPDWPRQTLQTGFCFFDEPDSAGGLPPPVKAFLTAGDPPVVFTLGSAAVFAAGEFYEESARAAELAGARALLLLGKNPAPSRLPPGVMAWDYLPYARIFPAAAAVVHQGGIGTTAQALRAGRPMIVVPFAYDQFDNAAQARRLGISHTIHRKRYRAERVARTLRTLLSSSKATQTAAEIGNRIRSESGTTRAGDAIEGALA
jgi:rhamnosyltransferase subunit B